MEWTVTLSKKARKNIRLLPKRVRKTLAYLIRELELTGPVKGNWPNYSKLGRARHHCHLKKVILPMLLYGKLKTRKCV